MIQSPIEVLNCEVLNSSFERKSENNWVKYHVKIYRLFYRI